MSDTKSLLARSLDAQFPATAAEDLLAYTAGDWLPEEDKAALGIYAQAKVGAVHEMIASLGDTEDEAELYNTLAFFWIELKTEWNRYNSVMNYQLFRNGKADNSVMARGTLGSAVLARFESLLTPADLAALTEVAAQPLEVGSPDVAQLQKFLDRHARATNVIGKAVALAEKAGASTSEIREEVKNARGLELDVVWPAIRDRVVSAVKSSRPFTLDPTWGYGDAIESLWLDGVSDAIATFIDTAFQNGSLKTPEERVAAGESAHVTFQVGFTFNDGAPTIGITWAGGPEATNVTPQPATPA